MKRIAFARRLAVLAALTAIAAVAPACDSSPAPSNTGGSGPAAGSAALSGSATASSAAPASAATPSGSAMASGPSTAAPGGSAGTVSAAGSAAPARESPPAAPSATATLARPLLWSIEKDGVTTYLLGTMHLGIDAETQLPPSVWAKLDAARAFAMEVDLDDASAVAGITKPSTQSLHHMLGEAYWKKLEDAVGAGTAQLLDHLPPMVPAAALAMRGLPMTAAMDKVLSARATREHKPIIFLEPTARQIELLGKWMDVKALKMLLDELPQSEARSKDMLAAYVAGDDQKVLAINDSERSDALRHGYTAAEYDHEMADMLYDRNASWIAPIERLHAAGGGFIAVGAMHLIGPRSVLDLLAHKGYRVTRLAS